MSNNNNNNTNTNMKCGYDEYVNLTREKARTWVLWAERYLDDSPERNRFTDRFCGDPQKWLEILRHYAGGGEVRTTGGASTESEHGLSFRGPVEHYEMKKVAQEMCGAEKAERSRVKPPAFDGKLVLEAFNYICAHGDGPVDLEWFDDIFAPHGVWLRELMLLFNRIRYTGEGEFVRFVRFRSEVEESDFDVVVGLFLRVKAAEAVAMRWKERCDAWDGVVAACMEHPAFAEALVRASCGKGGVK